MSIVGSGVTQSKEESTPQVSMIEARRSNVSMVATKWSRYGVGVYIVLAMAAMQVMCVGLQTSALPTGLLSS